ncbi:MAG: fumarylacetoacetate hydrolase family protein [Parvularculaceae bacterium]|nr:fumarylacetoacetate hydrolase family protein [Parvularculaceae bacterium]
MDVSRRAMLAAGVAATGSIGVGPAEAATRRGRGFQGSTTVIPIVGEAAAFGVRRIYCAGLNYRAHAEEMGVRIPTPPPPPFFFQKPTDAVDVAPFGSALRHPYPPKTADYHFEVELVVALRRGGRDLDAGAAAQSIFGYAVGLDMTRRDVQRALMEHRLPWEAAKAFDRSAVISPLTPADDSRLEKGAIGLSVDGQMRQAGDLSDMIWKPVDLIVALSQYYELFAGDLIYTGTPAGVGPVKPGETMKAMIEGVGEIEVVVTA